MYAITHRGMYGTLYQDGSVFRGRICLINRLGEYSASDPIACIQAFKARVDEWLAIVAVYEPEPVPTDGAPEFPGPVDPEPIPE